MSSSVCALSELCFLCVTASVWLKFNQKESRTLSEEEEDSVEEMMRMHHGSSRKDADIQIRQLGRNAGNTSMETRRESSISTEERWTRQVAEWNLGVITSLKSTEKTRGGQQKRGEHDVNDFVTIEVRVQS